jgi:hypothetical protein
VRDQESGRFMIEAVGEALLLLNGKRVERGFLLPGSQIRLGGAALTVSLAPVAQKNLRLAEALVWIFPLLVSVVQVVLIVVLR